MISLVINDSHSYLQTVLNRKIRLIFVNSSEFSDYKPRLIRKNRYIQLMLLLKGLIIIFITVRKTWKRKSKHI